MSRICLCICLFLTGCSNQNLAPETLAQQLTDPARRPFILDVRSEGEFQRGHIPGAEHLPFWNVAATLSQQQRDACKSQPVVVTCEHGPRAYIAAAALRRVGCAQVLLLEGHMARWRASRLPMIQGGD